VGFERALIPVEKEKEFNQLRDAIERVFAPERVEKFFATLKSKGLRIRDFDAVLAKRILETVDADLKRSGIRAQAIYEALSLSDKGQMREFYLGRLEYAPSELRRKFHQVYRDS
jgi:hypothetical protein